MRLTESFEKQGLFLFKYRGQFPVLLFLLVIPFMFDTDYSSLTYDLKFFLLFLALLCVVIGFFIRFYTIGTTTKGTSGRNTKEQIADSLNCTGVYSIVRHPLYLGNYLIWLGISITAFNIYFLLFMTVFFWLYYERIMFAEESFLEKKFQDSYLQWSAQVPSFIPSFSNYKKSNIRFSFISILRREYSSVFSCVIGFAYIEFIRTYVEDNRCFVSSKTIFVLMIVFLVVLILKGLRKYTKILDEEGRS